MASASGLGDLGRLPYDIRCLVWSEVANTNGALTEPCSLSSYLNLLQVSRDVYDEVNHVLFRGCVLQIELGPTSISRFEFSHDHSRSRQPSCSPVIQGSVQTPIILNSHSLGLFPFHILDKVVVNLASPYSLEMDGIFYMWKNVGIAVDVLKRAQALRHLTLFFRKGTLRDNPYKPTLRDFDYTFFIRPFGQLRPLTAFIETDSDPAVSLKYSKTINRALGTNYEAVANKELVGEQELRRELAKDWYKVCLMAGTPGQGWGTSLLTLMPLHQAILAEWLRETPCGKPEFVEQFSWIWANCRDIIWEINPSFSLLTKTRNALRYRTWITHQHGMDCAFTRKAAIRLDELAEAIEVALVNCWNWKHHQRPVQGDSEEMLNRHNQQVSAKISHPQSVALHSHIDGNFWETPTLSPSPKGM
ncbi:hypothetical protein BJX76DRAFT_260280 [Aspergillus varians]